MPTKNPVSEGIENVMNFFNSCTNSQNIENQNQVKIPDRIEERKNNIPTPQLTSNMTPIETPPKQEDSKLNIDNSDNSLIFHNNTGTIKEPDVLSSIRSSRNKKSSRKDLTETVVLQPKINTQNSNPHVLEEISIFYCYITDFHKKIIQWLVK